MHFQFRRGGALCLSGPCCRELLPGGEEMNIWSLKSNVLEFFSWTGEQLQE
jgi:hypothetical protein